MSYPNLNDILTSATLDRMFIENYRKNAPLHEQQEAALGILISQWAEWDGLTIMRVFQHALEDANFHTEANFVETMMIPLADNDDQASWSAFYEQFAK